MGEPPGSTKAGNQQITCHICTNSVAVNCLPNLMHLGKRHNLESLRGLWI